MTVYEYDESKDSILSIMDGIVGQYNSSGHQDSVLIFKMTDKTFTFKRGPNSVGFTVMVDNYIVNFNYGRSGRDKIIGGIAIETDLGRYRPQSLTIKDVCERASVRSHFNLTIRQLCNAAAEAVDEYKNMIKRMEE